MMKVRLIKKKYEIQIKIKYFTNFFPDVFDVNGHFCIIKDCPGWLVKIQEPLARQVKISLEAAVTPPGFLNFFYFVKKMSILNISFDIIEFYTYNFLNF